MELNYLYSSLTRFSQAYECGTYSADAYNETACDVSGSLVNTGEPVIYGLALGIVLICIPIVYYVGRHLKKRGRKSN
jgi:hypothetical protein